MLARLGALEKGLILAIAFLYLLHALTGIEYLNLLMGIMVLVTISLYMRKLKGLPLLLSLLFMLSGVGIFVVNGASFTEWTAAANVNVTLVTLFVFAPLFGIPIRAARYSESLKQLYQSRFRSRLAFFSVVQVMTQLIAIFVNVGSISIMYNLITVHPAARNLRLLSTALNRGFSGAMLWSPYFAGMALMTSQLGLSWSTILPWMLFLAAATIVVSVLVEWKLLFTKEEASIEQEEKQPIQKNYRNTYISLALYLLLTISIVLLLEQSISYPMVVIICFSAIVFPFMWSALVRELSNFKQGVKNHLTVTLPSMQKEITLFLSAGFISGAIKTMNLGTGLVELLAMINLPLSFTFSIATMLLIVITAALGLHPIVLVTIIASTISPESVGVSPYFVAILLLGSWSISNPISPVSAVNNILASLTHKDVFQFSRYNYRFTFFMGFIIIGYLLLIVR